MKMPPVALALGFRMIVFSVFVKISGKKPPVKNSSPQIPIVKIS
jgi:hypothetical protein